MPPKQYSLSGMTRHATYTLVETTRDPTMCFPEIVRTCDGDLLMCSEAAKRYATNYRDIRYLKVWHDARRAPSWAIRGVIRWRKPKGHPYPDVTYGKAERGTRRETFFALGEYLATIFPEKYGDLETFTVAWAPLDANKKPIVKGHTK